MSLFKKYFLNCGRTLQNKKKKKSHITLLLMKESNKIVLNNLVNVSLKRETKTAEITESIRVSCDIIIPNIC